MDWLPAPFVNTEEYLRPGAKLVSLHTQGWSAWVRGRDNQFTSLTDSSHLENQNMKSAGINVSHKTVTMAINCE